MNSYVMQDQTVVTDKVLYKVYPELNEIELFLFIDVKGKEDIE